MMSYGESSQLFIPTRDEVGPELKFVLVLVTEVTFLISCFVPTL